MQLDVPTIHPLLMCTRGKNRRRPRTKRERLNYATDSVIKIITLALLRAPQYFTQVFVCSIAGSEDIMFSREQLILYL